MNKNSGIARRVKIFSLWYFLQDASDRDFRLDAFLVVATLDREHERVDNHSHSFSPSELPSELSHSFYLTLSSPKTFSPKRSGECSLVQIKSTKAWTDSVLMTAQWKS